MSFFQLKHFPDKDLVIAHNASDYWIAILNIVILTVNLSVDAYSPYNVQGYLGALGFLSLLISLRNESLLLRLQVVTAVSFAVCGELWATTILHAYTYHTHNLPAYVIPGHGQAYLTAVILGRTAFIQRNARLVALFATVSGLIWGFYGISGYAPRIDGNGLFLMIIFLVFLYKGATPMIYLSCFFVTTGIEILGTYGMVWVWAEIDPLTSLPQGNPPCGAVAWYCLVDIVALYGGRGILRLYVKLNNFVNTLSIYVKVAITQSNIP